MAAQDIDYVELYTSVMAWHGTAQLVVTANRGKAVERDGSGAAV
jgi:hypothetical protein